jgi:hypothetical protein
LFLPLLFLSVVIILTITITLGSDLNNWLVWGIGIAWVVAAGLVLKD